MERLGYSLAEAHLHGWHEVWLWARHLGDGSATWRALHPKEATWCSEMGRAAMLADLIDCVNGLAWVTAQAHSKSRLTRPKPYPRPWAQDGSKSIGSGAIAIADFEAWYYDEQ